MNRSINEWINHEGIFIQIWSSHFISTNGSTKYAKPIHYFKKAGVNEMLPGCLTLSTRNSPWPVDYWPNYNQTNSNDHSDLERLLDSDLSNQVVMIVVNNSKGHVWWNIFLEGYRRDMHIIVVYILYKQYHKNISSSFPFYVGLLTLALWWLPPIYFGFEHSPHFEKHL